MINRANKSLSELDMRPDFIISMSTKTTHTKDNNIEMLNIIGAMPTLKSNNRKDKA